MKVLVLNCGSSSVKFRLFRMPEAEELAGGVAEQIGEAASRLSARCVDNNGTIAKEMIDRPIADHGEAVTMIEQMLKECGQIDETERLGAIGHRVVHGGERFQESTRINESVLETIRELSHLAPLHNPANLIGIEATLKHYPEVPQVAVFDTAFHQTMPRHAYRYAIAQKLYRKHAIRRYGFHGSSHRYVAGETAKFLGKPLDQTNLIVLHLGNGASTAAIKNGQSVDTSMGFTPLEGLVMGTRSGDLDPAIIFHLNNLGYGIDEIDEMLNRESGLKGICGSNDMRDVMQASIQGSGPATLALEIYCYRIRKYIGAYIAVLGDVDAIVFTAGVGENAPAIRAKSCEGLEHLGISVDADLNEAIDRQIHSISSTESKIKVLVAPTNEELEIARQTVDLVATAAVES